MASPLRSGMRMSSDERRTAVVAAAVHEFARGGLYGTSTDSIAVRAGISQPYLFRLFPTKHALFLAAVGRCFELVVETFERASEGLRGDDALDAMGLAYGALIADRDLLLLQLNAYGASSDPEIQEFVRDQYEKLAAYIVDRTGVDAEQLRAFFAMGMLCNVVAALGLSEVGEIWEDFECVPRLVDAADGSVAHPPGVAGGRAAAARTGTRPKLAT